VFPRAKIRMITKLTLLMSGERPYQCSACGKSYRQRVDLRLHLKRVHHDSSTAMILKKSESVPALVIEPGDSSIDSSAEATELILDDSAAEWRCQDLAELQRMIYDSSMLPEEFPALSWSWYPANAMQCNKCKKVCSKCSFGTRKFASRQSRADLGIFSMFG